MELMGNIGSFFSGDILNSRNTHNFMDPLVVEAKILGLLKDSKQQVKVANGERKISQGSYEETIRIDRTKFFVPFDVLTVGGCEIVLGVQWLKTLGPIIEILRLCNFL